MPDPLDTSALHTAQITTYLAIADRRIVSGFRMALELLGLPVPEAALRRPNGRPAIATVIASFNRDHPDQALAEAHAKLTRSPRHDPLNDLA